MEIFGCRPKAFFLGENGPLGSFPFFQAQLLKHRHVILLCIILLCIHICSVNDENPHIKIELKLWDATRSQQSHEELIPQRLQPTSVMEWCTIRHLQKQKILLCASGIHSELLDPISQIYGWLLCWIGQATSCLGLQEVPWPPYIATRGSLGGQSTRLNRVLID